MCLVENISFLKKYFPLVWEEVKTVENTPELESYLIEEAKNHELTIYIKSEDDHCHYIHSRYNPRNEAVKFLEQYEIKENQHVFFYGVGLGYLLSEFLRKYPQVSYSIYEPSPYIFYQYMSKKSLKEELTRLPENIYVEGINSNPTKFASHFVNQQPGDVEFIFHPSYEKAFAEKHKFFIESFLNVVGEKRHTYHINLLFEKRWVLNSLKNLPFTLSTNNIFEKKKHFQNKPVLLVSAGPSLSEEIENLRYIKQNGLAYIFSVGSAINSLIECGIHPDATCSFDPKVENVVVFQKIIDQNIDSIPLIFGSTVGYESLEQYPGPKTHMLIDQDTTAGYLLKSDHQENLYFLKDTPSIAIIVLQLLHKLNCKQVILVGQNFAYKNNRMYAEGIEYDYRPTNLTKEEENDAIQVEDVLGKQVYTSPGLNRMRLLMEMFIKEIKDIEVINTTKGGANIKGTHFIPLDEVIKTKLTEQVVERDWFINEQGKASYDLDHTEKRLRQLRRDAEELQELLSNLDSLVKKMAREADFGNSSGLFSVFTKFDRVFNGLEKNKCYDLIIKPMNRVRISLIAKLLSDLRFEQNEFVKARRVKKQLPHFILECSMDLIEVRKVLDQLLESVKNIRGASNIQLERVKK
ncbi:motility associated factor glycosyltransferase family protein [Brevibacillus borstelensis]|jgi:hypothetical protein|uniref:motility associated factor glycosyltransferase family protein n=1 Tax=Brevibacillus borstelensis TaxID=45462 RepID=UPI002E1B9B62|nr:DUF115 domain-containing protein [Brevibacillus borstelensis]